VNKVTSYLLLQNLKGWSPAQFEHLCAYLNHGFKLQYNGPRLPVQSKNSRSLSENPDLVRETILKEIDLGRVAGPFDYPPMPTFRVSPNTFVRMNIYLC
jgi:hypothetical protein